MKSASRAFGMPMRLSIVGDWLFGLLYFVGVLRGRALARRGPQDSLPTLGTTHKEMCETKLPMTMEMTQVSKKRPSGPGRQVSLDQRATGD